MKPANILVTPEQQVKVVVRWGVSSGRVANDVAGTRIEIMELPDGRRFEIRFIPGSPRGRNFEIIRELTSSAA